VRTGIESQVMSINEYSIWKPFGNDEAVLALMQKANARLA
jgi:hypothetical protein